MIKWILHRGIDKFERDWNYAGYVREVIDASPRAAWLFSRVTALGRFRRDLPIDAWSAAGITAVRDEDCGPCTQLAVTMAERAGVSPAVLRAVLADNSDACHRTWHWCGDSRARRLRTMLLPISIARRS